MGAEDNHQCIDKFAIWLIGKETRRLIGRFGFMEDDWEDLQQELKLDLLKHFPGYDPSRAKRTTFTKMVVEQSVSGLIEARKAKKRDYRLCTCSLNEEIQDGEGGSTERVETIATDDWLQATGKPGHLAEEQADLRLDLERLEARLSPGLRWLFENLKTKTPAEISRETGIPRSTLNNRIEKLLLLAVLAVESLRGRSAVRLGVSFYLDEKERACVLDASTGVGLDLARIFTGFLAEEFGEAAFAVVRGAKLGAGAGRTAAEKCRRMSAVAE